MKKFTKKFQVWAHGGDAYSLSEFDTIEEAVLSQKYTEDWYLTTVFAKYGERLEVQNFDHPTA